MEVKRILWPTDMTEESTQVMPLLASQASNYGAAIVVLHVMDEVARLKNVAKFMSQEESTSLFNAIKGDAETTLDKICSVLGDTCPLYERHVSEGDPAEEILKAIDEQNIDMVIMSTHTEGTKKVYSKANVAREVVKHAKVPVLTVPVK